MEIQRRGFEDSVTGGRCGQVRRQGREGGGGAMSLALAACQFLDDDGDGDGGDLQGCLKHDRVILVGEKVE